MRVILLSFCLLVMQQNAFAQDLAKSFYETHKTEESSAFFLYQSTLRSFSDVTSNEFNKLIKDIDKISIYVLPKSAVESKLVDELLADIEDEGFKIMKRVSQPAEGVNFYDYKGKNSAYLGVFHKDNNTFLVKLDGALDLKYIGSLKELNPEKIKTFFDFENLAKQFDID